MIGSVINLPETSANHPADNRDFTKELVMTHLRETISIHTCMFEKFLAEDLELSFQLAELFEDIANRYFDISEYISKSLTR